MFKNLFYITLFSLICWGSYQFSYPSDTPPDLFYKGVFLENTIEHIDYMTQGPRAVGERHHDDVQRYLIRKLNNLGFKVSTQRSVGFNPKNRTAAPVRNIIAKYQGTEPDGQDLLLLAHYDAAKFSGTGASDDASGVAVILETVNAYFKTQDQPKNNLIVLFTDAEEIGLLGAHAFINEQLHNHNIGLIINLEARGSSGPGMMWPETVGGNRAMIEAFQAADVPMPVTTSLHYEIYKLLPNDTDLTPFNQNGKINGFNIAFIDNHFNYHTRQDTLKNLSLNTLAHQSIQVQALLTHFAHADLDNLLSSESLVYLSIPVLGLISYPTWVNWLLIGLFGLIFISQVTAVIRTKQLQIKNISAALFNIISAALGAYLWCVLLLWGISIFYPETNDILQGFPYQGHAIMGSTLVGAGIIAMSLFGRKNHISASIVYISISFLLLIPLVYFMPGSGLLLTPVFLSVLLLLFQFKQPKWAEQMAPVFATLSFLLIGILIVNLPIALGIAALPFTAIIIVWLFSLNLPVNSDIIKFSHVAIALLIPLVFLGFYMFKNPNLTTENPHPTSLSYLYDSDKDQGYFYHYDYTYSGWHEEYFATVANADLLSDFRKNYKKPVKNLAEKVNPIKLNPIKINFDNPILRQHKDKYSLEIIANNNTDIIEIYTRTKLTLKAMIIDGRRIVLKEPLEVKAGSRLLRYYFNDKKNIKIDLELAQNDEIDWQVQSISTDLLQRPEFNLKPRPKHQIPKPFIQSDNTVMVQSITFGFD